MRRIERTNTFKRDYKCVKETGDWKDHRDCHIKPDLLLIYRKPDTRVLQLVRLGSHSELGL
jgi:addiction module RelE/StbE family toxin